jgi:hypothetical protein
MTSLAIHVLLLQVSWALAVDDAQCLMQMDVRHVQSNVQSPCACVPWEQAYSRGASCRNANGTGDELFFFHQRRPSPSEMPVLSLLVGAEFCDRFFGHLQGNSCVNRNMGADYGQWCYVSPECNNGVAGPAGGATPGQMYARVCTSHDANLRSLTPRQLLQRSIDQNLDLGLLHKMSYPLNTHLWSHVQAFWGIGGTPADLSPALRQEMSTIVATGAPHSFDTDYDQHPPHRIVVGRTVFAVEHNPHASPNIPSTWTVLSCVTGCDLPTAQ